MWLKFGGWPSCFSAWQSDVYILESGISPYSVFPKPVWYEFLFFIGTSYDFYDETELGKWLKTFATQSVVHGPASSATPGSLLELQNFSLYPRPIESEYVV